MTARTNGGIPRRGQPQASPMTYPEWLAYCRWLCDHGEPETPEERAASNSAKAAEMARAAQRRLPQPQLELKA